MDTSIFIARILGLVYLVIGLGVLFNTKYYQKMFSEMLKDTGMLYVGGVLALITGYLIVTYHNFWVKDWTVLVTIVGWLAFLKGFFLLILPSQFAGWTTNMVSKKNTPVMGICVLVLGLIFGYFGFFA